MFVLDPVDRIADLLKPGEAASWEWRWYCVECAASYPDTLDRPGACVECGGALEKIKRITIRRE